jgi:hypothetical protein
MQPNNPIADELRSIARALRRLGGLRCQLTFDERLRIAELMRDAADEIDRGEVRKPLPHSLSLAGVGLRNLPSTDQPTQGPPRDLASPTCRAGLADSGLKSSSSVFALWPPAPDVTTSLNPAPSSGALVHDKGLPDRGDRVIGCAAGTCCPDGGRSGTRSAQPGRAPGDTRTAPADAANADATNADATNADAANADATNADAASSAHGDFCDQRGVFSGRGDCGGSEAKLSGRHRLAGH